jgi:hypothetical protein
MNKFAKIIRISKIDAQKRQVWGIVTAEVPDKEHEVCDYEKSKPYYRAVIDEMGKATDGQNFFPLREMHQLSAVGKCIGFEFKDADKEIHMGFEVVDDDAWKKVDAKVYTGFSQGGTLVGDMLPDPVFKGCQRYVADPSEVSLVDNPCLGVAHFTYVKADGSVDICKFRNIAPDPDAERITDLEREVRMLKALIVKKGKTKRVAGEDLPASAFAYVGNTEDPATWNLPLKFSADAKTKVHIRQALAQFERTKGIPDGEKAAVHARIVGSAKQHGIDVESESKKLAAFIAAFRKGLRVYVNSRVGKIVSPRLENVDVDFGRMLHLSKGMYQVSNLAFALEELAQLYFMNINEQEWEGDVDSELPEMLRGNVTAVAATLAAMLDEETKELLASVNARAAA